MKRFVVSLKWFFAFTKRLFCKPSFLFTLLLIPAVCFIMNISSKEDSGIMTIAVTSYDLNDPVYAEISRELIDEASALLFVEYPTPNEAEEAVKCGEVSCAWIFNANLDELKKQYVTGNTDVKLCNVVLNYDTVLKKLSREKLHGVLFKNLSYDIFVDFMNSRNLDIEQANEENYRRIFDEQQKKLSDELIQFEFYNAPDKKIEDSNYLTSPLRGLLAVAMLICCLAAMLYSLDDENDGKYAMFPLHKRLGLHYLSVFAAAVFVLIAVLISLKMSDIIRESILREVLYLVLYAVISIGFCVGIGIIAKAKTRLCFAFPAVIVTTIVLCPIFVDVDGFSALKYILPTYHYLNAFTNEKYIWSMLVYAVVVYTFNYFVYKILNRE